MSDSQWIQKSKKYRWLYCSFQYLIWFVFAQENLQNNSSMQACCFWIKKISERWEKTTQVKSHVASEICVCSTKYSLQEFLDAKKFCGSKTPRNLKRLVLKSKHAVSAQEIFLERRKKLLAHFFGKINWSHQSLCMWTFAFNLSYRVSGINTHYSNKTSIKKIQSFVLKVELWVQ